LECGGLAPLWPAVSRTGKLEDTFSLPVRPKRRRGGALQRVAPNLKSIKHYFVHITPAPFFAGLEGFDDRMLAGLKMPGCMPIR